MSRKQFPKGRALAYHYPISGETEDYPKEKLIETGFPNVYEWATTVDDWQRRGLGNPKISRGLGLLKTRRKACVRASMRYKQRASQT